VSQALGRHLRQGLDRCLARLRRIAQMVRLRPRARYLRSSRTRAPLELGHKAQRATGALNAPNSGGMSECAHSADDAGSSQSFTDRGSQAKRVRARESDLFGRSLLLWEALPTAEQYCAMMNGRWIEHGRQRRMGSGAAAA